MQKFVFLVCFCFVAFSAHMCCSAGDWWQHDPIVDWGYGNDDIPLPDFSKLPKPDTDDIDGWHERVVISNLDLSGRDLRGAQIHVLGGVLSHCKFDNANLEGADFSETTLVNCSFLGANLKYTNLSPSSDCDLTGAILGGIARNLTAEQMQSTWNFQNKDFSRTVFLRCTFPDKEYDSSFNFTHSYTPGNLVNKIKLEDFCWWQLPQSVRWTGGFRNGEWEGYWTGNHAFRTREFRQKSLYGLTVSGVDFRNCDFSGFTLGFFENCTFQEANFKDAVKLTFHSLSDIPQKTFGFRKCDVTKEQIEQTRFWKERNMRGIILEDMNLDGWDFAGKDMSHASLKGSTVRNANFEDVAIFHTNLTSETLTIEQLMQTRSWKLKKIVGCTLTRISFDHCDLSGFDFSRTELIGCSFKNANLTGATLFLGSVGQNEGITEKQIRSLRNFREEMLQTREKE